MSSSAARARDEDQLVVGGLLPAVHGRFTSPRSYLSPDLSSSYSVASSITSSETAQTSLANGARSQRALLHWRLITKSISPTSNLSPTRRSHGGEQRLLIKRACGDCSNHTAASRPARLALHFRSFDYQRSSSHRNHSRCASRRRTPNKWEVSRSSLTQRA